MGCKSSKSSGIVSSMMGSKNDSFVTTPTPRSAESAKDFQVKHGSIKPMPGNFSYNITQENVALIKLGKEAISHENENHYSPEDDFVYDMKAPRRSSIGDTNFMKRIGDVMGSGRFKKSVPIEYQVEEKLGEFIFNFLKG